MRNPHTVGLVLVAWCLSCGQRDPSLGPVASTGSIAVTSTPDSAAIVLDGASTGQVTPDTVRGVSVGHHWVAVRKPGWRAQPCSLGVEVRAAETAHAHFVLQPEISRPILLESFTNTGCAPCAQANPMLYSLIEELGGGVVLMEFHTGFPSPLDPFYLAQRAVMDQRVGLYGVNQAPWLVVEGRVSFQPVTAERVREAVAGLQPQTEVEMTCACHVVDTTLTCRLTASSSSPGDFVLTLFVLDEREEFTTPPGSNGEREFRHVVRGALPAPCGQQVSLGAEPSEFVWATAVRWRAPGESLVVVGHARRTQDPACVGVAVSSVLEGR